MRVEVNMPEEYMGDVIEILTHVVDVSKVWMTSAAERSFVDSFHCQKCLILYRLYVPEHRTW